jgi:hypothetical protein
MRLPKAILALVPGAIHIAAGRPRRGLAYFTPFAVLANGVLLARLLLDSPAPWMACAIGAAAIWVAALVDGLRSARPAPAAAPAPVSEPPKEPVRS